MEEEEEEVEEEGGREQEEGEGVKRREWINDLAFSASGTHAHAGFSISRTKNYCLSYITGTLWRGDGGISSFAPL